MSGGPCAADAGGGGGEEAARTRASVLFPSSVSCAVCAREGGERGEGGEREEGAGVESARCGRARERVRIGIAGFLLPR